MANSCTQMLFGGRGAVVSSAGVLWLPLPPSLHHFPPCVCPGGPMAASSLPRTTLLHTSSEGREHSVFQDISFTITYLDTRIHVYI